MLKKLFFIFTLPLACAKKSKLRNGTRVPPGTESAPFWGTP
jgi:hypothetical protein